MLKTPASFTFAAFVLAVTPALAAPTRIWDVPFGTSIAGLGPDFVEPACGTNGGPPSTPLESFADYATCRAEPSGLREIWFRYDDVLEFMALAYRNPTAAMQNRQTVVNSFAVIVSFLVDDEGAIRGYRIFTDPAAPERQRYDAHLAGATFRALLGKDWTCTDLPKAEGEQPIEGSFVKSRCTIEKANRAAILETYFHLKAGQSVVDPATGKDTVNAFASSAQLEVLERQPYAALIAAPAVEATDLPADATAEQRFLAGDTNDCEGCKLVGVILSRRDLTGAHLAGADLTRATLHRATLRGADLSGATLVESNFNAADLTATRFVDANLTGALLYRVRGAQPDFSGAILSTARLGESELRQANFSEAVMDRVDLGNARINDADMTGATLTGSYFYEASLIRAKLTGVAATDTNFTSAILRNADLSGGDFHDTDFQGAKLESANLSNANLTHVRLLRATMRDAITTGAVFTNSLMPDGKEAP